MFCPFLFCDGFETRHDYDKKLQTYETACSTTRPKIRKIHNVKNVSCGVKVNIL